ncbi:MAG: imidazole glycerol phosphate synthase subunit HisH [Candidatus Omnitrophota bacterium]
MIAVIDYGMGNLRSVQKALEHTGAKAIITASKEMILAADKLVLPGVGAMKPAMDRLQELGLIAPLKEFIADGKPFLGICLGYQLLFDSSTEGGQVKGLGILPGTVERFPSTVKVPQMGWNQLSNIQRNSLMFKDVQEGEFVYFCHSFYVKPQDRAITATTTDYGISYASSVCSDNIWGVQFHPEKSQAVGLKLLENFGSC